MNSVPVSEFSRLCHLAPDSEPEWDSVTEAHHNILLEGPRDTTEPAILLFMPYLSEPIAWRRPGEALEFEAGLCRTLIVDDVGALDAEEQTRLWKWLDSARRLVQVVSDEQKRAIFLRDAWTLRRAAVLPIERHAGEMSLSCRTLSGGVKARS